MPPKQKINIIQLFNVSKNKKIYIFNLSLTDYTQGFATNLTTSRVNNPLRGQSSSPKTLI